MMSNERSNQYVWSLKDCRYGWSLKDCHCRQYAAACYVTCEQPSSQRSEDMPSGNVIGSW